MTREEAAAEIIAHAIDRHADAVRTLAEAVDARRKPQEPISGDCRPGAVSVDPQPENGVQGRFFDYEPHVTEPADQDNDKPADGTEQQIADVTDEPPVGTVVVTSTGRLYRRDDDGWHAWVRAIRRWGGNVYQWRHVRIAAPLRPATADELTSLGIAADQPDPVQQARHLLKGSDYVVVRRARPAFDIDDWRADAARLDLDRDLVVADLCRAYADALEAER